jgi:hypothetical protein
MDEAFLQLSVEDRREVLRVAADRSRRPASLLEKDVWVVWSLSTLYKSPLGDHLVFKGGTSLSKANCSARTPKLMPSAEPKNSVSRIAMEVSNLTFMASK